jgi:hypothetical protein
MGRALKNSFQHRQTYSTIWGKLRLNKEKIINNNEKKKRKRRRRKRGNTRGWRRQ